MTECRFLPMVCCRHPRRIAINPHTKDFGVGVKTCFHCSRHICPKCQWRDSHHTFCGRVCYRKYLLWRQVREAKWFVRRKGQALYSLLFNKASGISIGRNLIPLILPVLVLSSIHTYTTRYGEAEKTHIDREASIRSGNNVTVLKSNECKAMPTVNFNSRPVQG